VRIHSAQLWAAATNTYVVAAETGGEGVIVDAPPDPGAVAELVRQSGVTPVALLATHGHLDHVGGAGAVVARFAISAYLHPDDDYLAMDPEGQMRMLFGMAVPGDYAPPERYEALADEQRLGLAGLDIEVLHTPGHTPGHCCFWVPAEGVLFSGDQLFAGSIGRTDLPGGDFETLMRSMERRIVGLPPSSDVFPGHGPATTIARELAANPFLQVFRE
jgi:glyoxylase-like metal-dependent hydrolase (beta-lactamase superfamily II)